MMEEKRSSEKKTNKFEYSPNHNSRNKLNSSFGDARRKRIGSCHENLVFKSKRPTKPETRIESEVESISSGRSVPEEKFKVTSIPSQTFGKRVKSPTFQDTEYEREKSNGTYQINFDEKEKFNSSWNKESEIAANLPSDQRKLESNEGDIHNSSHGQIG